MLRSVMMILLRTCHRYHLCAFLDQGISCVTRVNLAIIITVHIVERKSPETRWEVGADYLAVRSYGGGAAVHKDEEDALERSDGLDVLDVEDAGH